MISIETQHFNFNRTLLLAIGLWPHQKSKFGRLQTTLCFGILTSYVIFQFTALITRKCTADLMIKIFSSATFFCFYIIKYNMFWINTHHVRNLLEQLQFICNELKDENEFAIIKKYGNNAKLCTAISTLFAICSTFSLILLPIWPQIFSTVLHINESRIQSQAIQITTEYFVDQEKYFYLILLHTNTVICIGATTLTATGTMLLGCAIHACGLFRVARFTDILISSFEGSFLLLITVSVICLSLNIYAVYRNALLGNEEAILLHLIVISVMLLYSFIANYAGQEITNHNNHVFFTAYNIQWYMAPLHAQKMILFILRRGNQASNLNVAGLFVPSLESFAMLTKASMSYFTVLYSMQQ